MTGIILVNDKTKGHAECLRKLGFDVTEATVSVKEKDDAGVESVVEKACLKVECDGFIAAGADKPIDCSTTEQAKASLKLAVSSRKLFTYKTRFAGPNGKVVFGLQACRLLGGLSCLIAKPETTAKATSPSLLGGLNLEDLI